MPAIEGYVWIISAKRATKAETASRKPEDECNGSAARELVEEAEMAALRFLVPWIFWSHQSDGLQRVWQGCKELQLFRSLLCLCNTFARPRVSV